MQQIAVRRQAVGWCAAMVAGWLLFPVAVFAHAHLLKSAPAADSKSGEVREITLQFSEPVEAKLSSVHLQDREDRNVVEPAAETVHDHPDSLVLHLYESLAPGQYRVQWNVVSADGHRMKGEYRFLVSR